MTDDQRLWHDHGFAQGVRATIEAVLEHKGLPRKVRAWLLQEWADWASHSTNPNWRNIPVDPAAVLPDLRAMMTEIQESQKKVVDRGRGGG